MSVYAEIQPIYMQKRIDEMNKQLEAQQQNIVQAQEQQEVTQQVQAEK